jgi:hypothetical protein
LYAFAVGAVLCRSRRVSWHRLLRPVVVAGAFGILLGLPLARPYIAAQARKGPRDIPAVRFFSARASDYLRAHERSARYGPYLSGGKPERALFPGVTPLVFTSAALMPLGATRLAYLAGLVVAFDGSLGMNGLVYPYLYDWFLPVRGLRVPARFSVLVGLSLAVLAGFGTRRLLRRHVRWKGHVLFGALIVLVAADLQPDLGLEPVWREPPAIYASVAGDPGVVLAEFPFPTDPLDLMHNLPYMYFSVWHGAEMVNGYSGFSPPDYPDFSQSLAGFPEQGALSLLKQRGVTHVTVNCALYRDGCDTVLDAVAATPALRLVAQTKWQGQPVNLYELSP